MEKVINVDEKILQKIISELKEIENLTPDGMVKFRINNLLKMVENNICKDDISESLQDTIYKKMKEAVTKNPELHVKLYMLYRNLSDGKVSMEEAKELYETYLQMYPYDTIIY